LKKFLALTFSALLLVSLLALSGCGKKETPPAPEAAQTPQTEQTNQSTEQSTEQQQPADKPADAQTAQPVAPSTAEPASKPAEDKAKEPAQAEAPKPAAPEKTPFEAYLETLPGKLNPDNVKGMTIVYQFNITDGHPGLYWVKIEDGKCTTGKGAVAKYDTKINVGEQLWLDMRSEKVNGTMAYLSKKFTVDGNTDYLSDMKKYFTK
jgi:putative sterol carrier protein/predicted small lipoprotein YifL